MIDSSDNLAFRMPSDMTAEDNPVPLHGNNENDRDDHQPEATRAYRDRVTATDTRTKITNAFERDQIRRPPVI